MNSVYILYITMTSMEIVIGLKINLVRYITIDFLMGLRMLQKRIQFNFWVFWGAISPMMKF